jgi:hypothetical protein
VTVEEPVVACCRCEKTMLSPHNIIKTRNNLASCDFSQLVVSGRWRSRNYITLRHFGITEFEKPCSMSIFFNSFISNQNYSDSISYFADFIYDMKRLIQ